MRSLALAFRASCSAWYCLVAPLKNKLFCAAPIVVFAESKVSRIWGKLLFTSTKVWSKWLVAWERFFTMLCISGVSTNPVSSLYGKASGVGRPFSYCSFYYSFRGFRHQPEGQERGFPLLHQQNNRQGLYLLQTINLQQEAARHASRLHCPVECRRNREMCQQVRATEESSTWRSFWPRRWSRNKHRYFSTTSTTMGKQEIRTSPLIKFLQQEITSQAGK